MSPQQKLKNATMNYISKLCKLFCVSVKTLLHRLETLSNMSPLCWIDWEGKQHQIRQKNPSSTLQQRRHPYHAMLGCYEHAHTPMKKQCMEFVFASYKKGWWDVYRRATLTFSNPHRNAACLFMLISEHSLAVQVYRNHAQLNY